MNAGVRRSSPEVSSAAEMLPFMLACSSFHLPLLPEEMARGGVVVGVGEEDLWGEAGGVTRCIRGVEMILNQRERLGGSRTPFLFLICRLTFSSHCIIFKGTCSEMRLEESATVAVTPASP